MSRTRTICAAAMAATCLFGAPRAVHAACTTLTPASLRHDLYERQFAFDDEGLTKQVLFLDLTAIADDGTFQGTLATSLTPLPTPPIDRQVVPVRGLLKPTADGVLSIVFSTQPVLNGTTTYSGAIQVYPSCALAIAGTYVSEDVIGVAGPGGVQHYPVGPAPFSGKTVRVPDVHPG